MRSTVAPASTPRPPTATDVPLVAPSCAGGMFFPQTLESCFVFVGKSTAAFRSGFVAKSTAAFRSGDSCSRRAGRGAHAIGCPSSSTSFFFFGGRTHQTPHRHYPIASCHLGLAYRTAHHLFPPRWIVGISPPPSFWSSLRRASCTECSRMPRPRCVHGTGRNPKARRCSSRHLASRLEACVGPLVCVHRRKCTLCAS